MPAAAGLSLEWAGQPGPPSLAGDAEGGLPPLTQPGWEAAVASPLTMCDPTERLPWGPLPESTPWALLNPACSSAWASGPFLSLVVLASGCPCQRVGAPAPSRAETHPPGVTVSQAQTGGGVFATVPMVQTQRQKSEAGITGQDQAQGSRYLFTRAAPGKSGLHARGKGERVLALESREGTRCIQVK